MKNVYSMPRDLTDDALYADPGIPSDAASPRSLSAPARHAMPTRPYHYRGPFPEHGVPVHERLTVSWQGARAITAVSECAGLNGCKWDGSDCIVWVQ